MSKMTVKGDEWVAVNQVIDDILKTDEVMREEDRISWFEDDILEEVYTIAKRFKKLRDYSHRSIKGFLTRNDISHSVLPDNYDESVPEKMKLSIRDGKEWQALENLLCYIYEVYVVRDEGILVQVFKQGEVEVEDVDKFSKYGQICLREILNRIQLLPKRAISGKRAISTKYDLDREYDDVDDMRDKEYHRRRREVFKKVEE